MPAGLIAWMKTYLVAVRVIGTFLALIVAFFFILTWEPIVEQIDLGAGLAKLAAWMSFGILRLFGAAAGFDVRLDGTIMASGAFEVDVAPACSGAVPTSIYLSAVLAYPTGWRAKAIGAGMGVVVIHLINLLRVAGLFLVGLYFREVFHETHVYVAQSLVVCCAVALWLYWVTRFADVARGGVGARLTVDGSP